MNANNEQLYLIVENSKVNLNMVQNSEKKDEFILEGIFAELGIENNNERIYEENEYLPHLEYLVKKIEKGTLFGEIDHPERFDVKLDEISHVVESLTHNKEERTITGRVRVLSTPKGEIAKSLLREGVNLSISSRSAGTVDENKKVKIQQIFAYDLVAEPGFERAGLTRVNESLGFLNTENLAIYEINDTNIEKIKNGTNMSLDKNMKLINEQLDDFKLKLDEATQNGDVDKIKEWCNTAAIDINRNLNENDSMREKLIDYTDYIMERAEKTGEYSKYLGENLNGIYDTVGQLSEKVDKIVQYIDYIGNKTEQSIRHTDHVVEKVDQSIAYTENLGETVNKAINYTEQIGETVNQSIAHTNHVAEVVDKNIHYSDHLGEKVNQNINFSEYGFEKVDQVIRYAESLAEEMNTRTPASTEVESKSESFSTGELSAKVDDLIASVRQKENQKVNEQMTFNYMSLLSNDKQRSFKANVGRRNQKNILDKCKTSGIVTEQQFLNIWKAVLNEQEYGTTHEDVLNGIPKEYKEVWKGLNEDKKQNILKQSELYSLRTPEEIQQFWDLRTGLNEALANLEYRHSLNESQIVPKQMQESGHSNDYMQLASLTNIN